MILQVEVEEGSGSLGLTYSSCPWWKREDGRPIIRIHLWFWSVFIHPPFKHQTPKGHGSATSDYGIFWWPRLKLIPRLSWRTLK